MSDLSNKRKALADALMRDAIGDAASQVLIEHGWEGMTMDRVAQAAKVAKGTLYNYYGSKEEMLFHIMDTAFGPLRQHIAEVAATPAPPTARLHRILQAAFEMISNLHALFVVLPVAEALSPAIKQHCRSLRRQFIEVIQNVLDSGIASKDFRRMDSRFTAQLIAGMVDLLITERIEQPETAPPIAEQVAALIEFTENGIKQHQSA